MVPLAIVVLKAPPALTACKINEPLAAVAGKEVTVPAWPEEPAIRLPVVVATLPVATVSPKARVEVVVWALIFPDVSENTASALAVDAPPENDTPPALGSESQLNALIPKMDGNGSTMEKKLPAFTEPAPT